MDDRQIVELYFERNENAISETAKKYGKYCHSIANNILASSEDAKECVNDTYMRAWSAIPPARPEKLSTFLGKIVRNLSLNRYAYNKAKRRSDNLETVLSEVEEFIPSLDGEPSDAITVKDALNSFVASLSERDRIVFVQRYFYLLQIKEIAQKRGLSEANVKVILSRTRNKLKSHLEKEGITV